ncbi:MAG: hypothetical protein LBB14_00915 [Puniceicoccales bacterium]|jgi:hypothetical protein|nr:hypothetical protein [Puniceicoccales bacterium]
MADRDEEKLKRAIGDFCRSPDSKLPFVEDEIRKEKEKWAKELARMSKGPKIGT